MSLSCCARFRGGEGETEIIEFHPITALLCAREQISCSGRPGEHLDHLRNRPSDFYEKRGRPVSLRSAAFTITVRNHHEDDIAYRFP